MVIAQNQQDTKWANVVDVVIFTQARVSSVIKGRDDIIISDSVASTSVE